MGAAYATRQLASSTAIGSFLRHDSEAQVNPCDVDYVEFGFGCPGGKGIPDRPKRSAAAAIIRMMQAAHQVH